jgi:hypothetical protein
MQGVRGSNPRTSTIETRVMSLYKTRVMSLYKTRVMSLYKTRERGSHRQNEREPPRNKAAPPAHTHAPPEGGEGPRKRKGVGEEEPYHVTQRSMGRSERQCPWRCHTPQLGVTRATRIE